MECQPRCLNALHNLRASSKVGSPDNTTALERLHACENWKEQSTAVSVLYQALAAPPPCAHATLQCSSSRWVLSLLCCCCFNLGDSDVILGEVSAGMRQQAAAGLFALPTTEVAFNKMGMRACRAAGPQACGIRRAEPGSDVRPRHG